MKGKDMINISVVVPVYNSSDCLPELARRVHETLKDNYELILVNDQSTDESWEVVCDIIKKDDFIVGVNLRINSGQDNALLAGLRQAQGNYTVIMDDDLQHAPEDIIKLVEKCREGYDVCCADFEIKKQKWWKNIGSWINGKMAEILLNKPKQIYLSPFKIIKKEVVDEICLYRGPFPYVDGLILSITHNLTQVQVSHYERFSGISTYSFRKSLTVWAKHLTGFSVFPLRLASFMGIFLAFLGFLLAAYYIFYYLSYGTIQGWTTLACLVLVIGGFTLMSLGMIGEYVGRTYLNVNHRPQYIIKEVLRKS
ncbi:glycosyltransferase family 2 protein [Thermodesulfobacteriota bacterium]